MYTYAYWADYHQNLISDHVLLRCRRIKRVPPDMVNMLSIVLLS